MILEKDFYEDYGLDPNDLSITEIVHLFHKTMTDALDDEKPMSDFFNEFALAWSKFKTMPESAQKKCEHMVDDFQYMWSASAQSMIDDLLLLIKLANLGDTTVYDKIRISCLNIIKAVPNSDETLWEDAPCLYNALLAINDRGNIPQECQLQIHILMEKISQLLKE